MKNLMQKLFGARAPAAPPKAVRGSNHDDPPTIQEGSENATRRQLVQVLLRDVVRRHGLPPHWIDLQMMVVASSSRGPGMYVRLVVKQWDQRLMNHAYALQKALLADIARFEPRASEWLHGLSWQLEFGDTCPFVTLPGKSFWLEPVNQGSPEVQAPVAVVAPAPAAVAPAAPAGDFPALAALAAFAAPAPVAPVVAVAVAAVARVNLPEKSVQAAQDNDALQDLERLFLIRDQEIGRQADGDHAPVGYEKTQPSPL